MDVSSEYQFNNYLMDNDTPVTATWGNLHKKTFPDNTLMQSVGNENANSTNRDVWGALSGADHYKYTPYYGNLTPCWKTKDYNINAIGLHEEILDFYSYISPRQCEDTMRKEVVERVTKIIQDKWPEAKLEVFGSFNTGLYLPTSDIDIVVFGDWPSPPLFTVEQELKKADIPVPTSLMVLDKTSVPIIKFMDKSSKVKVDISFNMESGLLSAEKIKSYLKQYPLLDKLVLVIKQFLYQRGLNEVYTGGIGSYNLILLVVSFLQRHPRDITADANLGVLLVEFFELYGRNFNYAIVGIKVDGTGSYFNKIEQRMNDSVLCIIDPADPTNNVGRGCFGMWDVKRAFEHAYVTLARVLLNTGTKDLHRNNKTVLSLILSVPKEVDDYRQWVEQQWGSSENNALHSTTNNSKATNSVTRNRCGSAVDAMSDNKSNQQNYATATTRISS